MSHQAYGPLVGVPRLLDLLDRHGVRATFFVPGYTAHRHPGMAQRRRGRYARSPWQDTKSPTTATSTKPWSS